MNLNIVLVDSHIYNIFGWFNYQSCFYMLNHIYMLAADYYGLELVKLLNRSLSTF